MFYMHWLLCKMNLPFHYYLVTVLVFHLYRFCAASRGGNSLRKSNIKTWRQQTIIGVRTFTPEVTFLSLLCSFQGKKKNLDSNKPELVMARTHSSGAALTKSTAVMKSHSPSPWGLNNYFITQINTQNQRFLSSVLLFKSICLGMAESVHVLWLQTKSSNTSPHLPP